MQPSHKSGETAPDRLFNSQRDNGETKYLGVLGDNLRMSADCLTKSQGDTKPFFEILEQHTYEITICSQSGRKEKQEQQSQ